MMDMGCYVMSCVRYLAGTEPSSVISATADLLPADTRIDTGTTAVLAFPNDVTAEIMCHSLMPGWGPLGLLPRFPAVNVEARCEGGVVSLSNFVVPHIWHSINVTMSGGQKRVEKVYTYKDGKEKGEAWWSTYRWQLEAFVDKVKGREPQTWMTAEDSIANLEWIEKVYEKSALGSRPQSNFLLVN